MHYKSQRSTEEDPLEDDKQRQLASESLVQIIESIREQESLPVVLIGDFNTAMDSPELQPLFQLGYANLLSTENNVAAVSWVGGNSITPNALFDNFFVPPELSLTDATPSESTSLRLDQIIANYQNDISDHVPIAFKILYP